MLEILNGDKKVIKQNIKLLAKTYKEKTGRKVCLSCPSDVAYMISSLKTILKMKNFEFKKPFAQYKNKKGDKVTISNSNMTDETAIEFLKTNPKRIELFSKYPENWEELCTGKASLEDIKVNGAETVKGSEGGEGGDGCCEEGEKEPCEKCIQEKREELMKVKLKDLKKQYPEVKYKVGMKTTEFIELVLKEIFKKEEK